VITYDHRVESVDRDDPELLSEQVAEIIRRQIESGELGPRRKLPTQQAMVDLYDVSRGTVLRACEILTGEGLIRFVAGRGLYTVDAPAIAAWKKERAKRK
jgi:DNA-binding GntR family transcriptional regulator